MPQPFPFEYELGPTGIYPQTLTPWKPEGPSRAVFTHQRHARLVEEDVRMPDGSVATWLRHADAREQVCVRDSVAALCLRDDGKVLVSWQWNLGPRRTVAEFPGGGVNDGEAYEDAVRREVAEEVGLWARRVEPLGTHLFDNRRSSAMLRWFVLRDLEPTRLAGDEAEVATCWLTPDEVDDAIADGRVENMTMLAGWALYTATARRAR